MGLTVQYGYRYGDITVIVLVFSTEVHDRMINFRSEGT